MLVIVNNKVIFSLVIVINPNLGMSLVWFQASKHENLLWASITKQHIKLKPHVTIQYQSVETLEIFDGLVPFFSQILHSFLEVFMYIWYCVDSGQIQATAMIENLNVDSS